MNTRFAPRVLKIRAQQEILQPFWSLRHLITNNIAIWSSTVSDQPPVPRSAIKGPIIVFRAIAMLTVVATLAACEFSQATTPVAKDSTAAVEAIESRHDNALTRNELSFLLTLNASERADITELLAELADWDFQRHQLEEVLRDLVVADEIGLSKRTLSGDRVLTAEETDALLATFPKVDDPGYFLFLTDAGISKWKIENWDITESRAQAIMFAPHSGETEGDA